MFLYNHTRDYDIQKLIKNDVHTLACSSKINVFRFRVWFHPVLGCQAGE